MPNKDSNTMIYMHFFVLMGREIMLMIEYSALKQQQQAQQRLLDAHPRHPSARTRGGPPW